MTFNSNAMPVILSDSHNVVLRGEMGRKILLDAIRVEKGFTDAIILMRSIQFIFIRLNRARKQYGYCCCGGGGAGCLDSTDYPRKTLKSMCAKWVN